MNSRIDRRQRHTGTFLAGASTAIIMAAGFLAATPAAAAEFAPDGKSELAAAASCWEAKQTDPSAGSGVYWLLTPAMPAPEQFYCDQGTDGGGWVLIGRGREGWKELYEGRGTAAEVSSSVTGPSAFSPRQLAARTIDELLNGGAPDQLEDGIRLRRATNADGTSWQEARFSPARQHRWSWAFSSETPLTSYSFGAGTFSGGRTSNFGRNQDYERVVTSEASSQDWTQGWAFGANISGDNNSSSYLWSANSNVGNARPFTQMFIRPKHTQDTVNFAAIPDAGTKEHEQRSIQQTGAIPTAWGVTGLANGRSGEFNTEAQAFTQIGDVVYVGGNFQYVQRNSAGADRTEQSYLAAFNVHSGEWISEFRPVLDGQVKKLEVLPGGKLLAGGEFSTANGTSSAGVVALDASTGATYDGWTVGMENRLTGGTVQVNGLAVEDGWVYIGGNFTHLRGGSSANPAYARAAARVSAADGTPDSGWNPAFNGTVLDIDASDDGTRLYASGYFDMSNSSPALRVAAVQTSAGAPLATPAWDWTPSSTRANFQFGIEQVGDRVWIGGSEHNLFMFDPATFDRLSSNITRQGGDFQDVSSANGLVYGSCHCGHWNYSGGDLWPSIGASWTIADKINLTGIWDAATGEYLPDFNPVMKGRGGYGIWGSFVDSRGTLWLGGDLDSSVNFNGGSQWSGGFARFALNDSSAPGAPGDLSVTGDGTLDTLSWPASSGSPTVYHVLREDRVIATTTSTSAAVPAASGARYAVRAADAAGNYSASTPVEAAPEIDELPEPPIELITEGSVWKYRFDNAALASDWTSVTFDDSSWETGASPLGWGDSSIETELTSEGTKPLSSHYRKTFTVNDAGAISAVNISTRADDGIVLYVNGDEVGRSNMPDGPITNNSYAVNAPSTSNAVAAPVRITVPGWALVDGANVISAEVHSNWRTTPNASFDLTAVATIGEQPPAPEPDPGEPAPEEPDDGSVLLQAGADWKYRFDNSAPPVDWAGTAFDDGAWSTGAAPLGWGHESIVTELSVEGTNPLSSQYRRTIAIADVSVLESVELTTRADDGIVLYVNGEEAGRANMPEGEVTYNSYALNAPNTANALASPTTFTVPGWMFVAGTNVIAAEVHSNWRTTPNASFDLTAVATIGEQPAEPEVAPQPRLLVDESADWKYRFEDSAPDSAWLSTEYDDTPWLGGGAPLGWGSDGIVTDLNAEGTTPLSSHYRTSFSVDDAAAIAEFEIITRADDGVVVYVNGQEVLRANMPAGTVAYNSYALTAPNTAAAEENAITAAVPGGVLRDGINVIAAEVHSNYRNTANVSFALTAAVPVVQEAQAQMQQEVGAPKTFSTFNEAELETDVDQAAAAPPEKDPAVEDQQSVPAVAPAQDKQSPAAAEQDTPRAPGMQSEEKDIPGTDASGSSDDEWTYLLTTGQVHEDWTSPDFDAEAWDSGEGPLGWGGDDVIETAIEWETAETGASLYLRRSLKPSDPSKPGRFFSLPQVPGMTVRLNGTEIAPVAAQEQRGSAEPGQDEDPHMTYEIPEDMDRSDGIVLAITIEVDPKDPIPATLIFDPQVTTGKESIQTRGNNDGNTKNNVRRTQ